MSKAIAKYLRVPGEFGDQHPVVFPQVLVIDRKDAKDNGLYTLFAVTQDFVPGDDVRCKKDGVYYDAVYKKDEEWVGVVLGDGSYDDMYDDMFKVLGELSPNATWGIKDRDEIEVRILDDSGMRKYFPEAEKTTGFCQVLGPCGHYH